MSIEQLQALTTALIAIVGALVGIGAHRLNKAGQAATARTDRAAQQLSERIQEHAELRDYADRLEREREHADERHTADFARQAERCRTTQAGLLDAVRTLQSVVVGQVAVTAAQDAIDAADIHTRLDHPESTSQKETP